MGNVGGVPVLQTFYPNITDSPVGKSNCQPPHCCIWSPRNGVYPDSDTYQDLRGKPVIGPDTVIQAITFYVEQGYAASGIRSITFNTIQRVIKGLKGFELFPYTRQGAIFNTSYDSYWHVGGSRGGIVTKSPPDDGYVLSGMQFYMSTTYNTMRGPALRWINVRDYSFKYSPLGGFAWLDGSLTPPGTDQCGFTQYPPSETPEDAYILQSFDVTWGAGTADTLSNFYNVQMLNVKKIYDYALSRALPAPGILRPPNSDSLDLSLNSDFSKIGGGYYRDSLVSRYCNPAAWPERKVPPDGKITGGPPPICWCLNPEFAYFGPENAIAIDRSLKNIRTQQGIVTQDVAVCWSGDCNTSVNSGTSQKFLHLSTDTKVCPKADNLNLCIVNVQTFDSKDSQAIIEALNLQCNFSNTKLPPGCEKPENKDNPICKQYLTDCNKPENKDKPECKGPTPPKPVVDCTKPENKNLPECKAKPDCTKPENKNLPECKAPVVDCTLLENRNRPECKTPAIDCTKPENKDKAECKGKEEEQTFWQKYMWWIIIGVVVLVVFIGIAIFFATRSSSTEEAVIEGQPPSTTT